MTVALMNTVIAAIDYAPPPSLTSIFTAAQLTLWPTLPADQLIPAVQTAPYTLNTVNFVIREYQLALGGVPDVGGAAYWTHALSDGAQTDESMSFTFASSTEFFNTYGISATTVLDGSTQAVNYVEHLFKNAFNETLTQADPGVAYWAGLAANSPHLDAAQTLDAFVVSAQFIQLTATPITVFQDDQVNAAQGLTPGVPPPRTSLFALPSAAFTLTPGVDGPSGFTATTAGAVFNAQPVAGVLGLNNTLNTLDNLQDTKGDGTLNLTEVAATAGLLANPPFATGVTLNGLSVLNVSNQATVLGIPLNGGFQGSVTGLTVVNNNNSIASVQLGGTGDGLETLLTNYNINNYAGPAEDAFKNIIATSAADLTKTINIGITGPLGATTGGAATEIVFSNNSGTPGTGASPNNTYGTWAITYNSTTFAQLDQGISEVVADVGGATKLTLTGSNAAATIGLGTNFAGDWQLLQSIDETATTGRVIITGATAGNDTNFLGSATDPGWLLGSDAGLLDDSGTGGAFALTSVKLGSGLDVLDISSATAGQVANLTTGPGTGVTVNAGNILIVQDSVATTGSAATFKNIAGFSTLGIGGPTVAQGAAGVINMANMTGTGINTLLYVTQANNSVTVDNGVNNLTVNVDHNTPRTGSAVTLSTLGINDASTTSTTDTVTLILGDTVGTVGGITGAGAIDFNGAINGLTTTGYANVDIHSNGPTAGVHANILSGISEANVFIANPGALETLTISGSTELINNAIFVDGIGGTGVITDNDLSATQIFAFGHNAAFSAGGPTFVATNAAVINAGGSGGLWMGGSDVQFNGLVGDIITGSSTASNVLAGSVSNDVFNGGSATDLIITDNGADTVNLAASHAAATIDLFFGNFEGNGGGFNGTAAGTFTHVTGLAASITAAGPVDFVAPGTWGLAPAVNGASTPVGINTTENPFALFPGTTATNNGTSADMTTVNNFNTGSDVVAFSVGAWGKGGAVHGLVNADMLGGGTQVTVGTTDCNLCPLVRPSPLGQTS